MKKFKIAIFSILFLILSVPAFSESTYYESVNVEMLLASKTSLSVLVSNRCRGCSNRVYKIRESTLISDVDGTILKHDVSHFQSKKKFYANIEVNGDTMTRMSIRRYIK